MKFCVLFCPPMATVIIRADIVQSHLLLGSSGLSLEEYSFSMIAFRARMLLRSRQCRIRYYIRDNVRQFAIKINKKIIIEKIDADDYRISERFQRNLLNLVHNFVYVNAVAVSQLFKVTISAL